MGLRRINQGLPQPVSILLLLGLLLATIYLAAVFVGRISRRANVESDARQQEAARVAPYADEDFTSLRILNFYASPPQVKPGEKALLCYGVQGADVVSIDGLDQDLRPSRNRCLEITPPRTTTYTLTVEAETETRTASVTLQVRD